MKDTLFEDFQFNGYTFSTDKTKLQVPVIHQYLSGESYWAKGIPLETVTGSIQHSICIGIYADDGEQVGFGRMITDRNTFAYIADVFILSAHRGVGLSKELMNTFCKLSDQFGLRRTLLVTLDAQGLYKQYGFEIFPNPERMMTRKGVTYI